MDYAESLLSLRQYTRSYSDNMRDGHYADARREAGQIARCALACIDDAKEAEQLQQTTIRARFLSECG